MGCTMTNTVKRTFDLDRPIAPRTREAQIARIRKRVAAIETSTCDPNDGLDKLLNVVKGIMDIIEDDGRDEQ